MRILFVLFFTLTGFSSLAQNDLLAKNYFEQGEYEKAATIYEKLVAKSPNDNNLLRSLAKTYQELERYQEAGELFKSRLEGRRVYPQFYIELGYNYSLQLKDSLAKIEYNKAIDYLKEQPVYAYTLGRSFSDYSLLDEAEKVYTTAMALNPSRDYYPQLARIYGEQGKLELMFDTYINLIQSNPDYLYAIKRNFSSYITDNPDNEANQMLRKTLLKRLQNDPDVLYNELLSWLFIQQKDFRKAFIQEKAIFARREESLTGVRDLASIAIDEKSYEDARSIVEFVIEKSYNPKVKMNAFQQLMFIDLQLATEKDYPKIEASFQELFKEYGMGADTYLLQIDYNHFLAFRKGEKVQAITNLRELAQRNLNAYQEARVKLQLADILVLDERFNEALIYYSQVQNKVKNDVLAQEARFKVARTSYFKGDFEWAQIQLDVLKKSASQLIANDAMQLSLMISDNSLEDSTQTALKKFSAADLKELQGKDEQAISLLEAILLEHKGEAIEDEALLKLGGIQEKLGYYEKAIVTYNRLIEFYGEDILADDAHYRIAKLYDTKLSEPVKAKREYETLIFNFEDSIYFVEARKRYRILRGDEIN